jgi:hypothetical protein
MVMPARQFPRDQVWNQAVAATPVTQHSKPKRKPGRDIGEDFGIIVPLPEAGDIDFRLDDNGVF